MELQRGWILEPELNQLQQLQQLQNQIFQQQIALISGGNQSSDSPAPESSRYHGLPTPGSSSELRAQQPPKYISPMILHYMENPQDQYSDHGHNMSQYYAPWGSASAPAHIAFKNAGGFASDLNFDSISPLTSPWLGDQNPPMNSMHQQQQQSSRVQKRTASPSNSTEEPSRKMRQSPAIRPTVPIPRRTTRGSKSTTSTPLLRSTRSSMGDIPGDSPSPVDLSMPPPAAPSASYNGGGGGDRMDISSLSLSMQHLTLVTPANIMNLGRMGLDPPAALSKPAKVKLRMRAQSSTGAKAPKKNVEPRADSADSEPPCKISHKAAEQKRHDLKQYKNFPDEPILPSVLPPQGPPKADGEGPNKGVSKLQLLQCRNDFIRQLKGHVDRKDTEIDTLRREIMRLRLDGHGRGHLEMDEMIDLEKNLDAEEAFGVLLGRGGPMDEDEDEDEDD